MKYTIVIPSRMGSTRFPGKPLCDLNGKPMLQWVVEAAQKAQGAEQILIATPDQEILDLAKKLKVQGVLTGHHHSTGTDRIAEVAQKVHAEIFINVQGDEPLICPESIEACAKPLLEDPEILVSSLFSDCPEDEIANPNVVKVVTNQKGYALYFSRSVIPYPRMPRTEAAKRHIGLYGYRQKALSRFSEAAISPLEYMEGLEQLRFLDLGIPIFMAKGEGTKTAIDTPEQAEIVRQILNV